MPSPNDDVRVVVIDSNELRRDWRAKLTRPVVGWALAALGAVFIVVGYLGVAHEALVAKQIPYLVSGGIGGMVLVAVGAFLLGTDDVRRQLQRVEQLEEMVQDLHSTLLTPAGGAGTTSAGAGVGAGAAGAAGASPSHAVITNGAVAGDDADLVALRRGKTYHVAGCTMVAGKEAPSIDLDEVRERDLKPCPLCSPTLATAR